MCERLDALLPGVACRLERASAQGRRGIEALQEEVAERGHVRLEALLLRVRAKARARARARVSLTLTVRVRVSLTLTLTRLEALLA